MRRRFLLPPLLATCLLLSGCGKTVREFLDATYTREVTTGGISVYVSPEPVAVTALRISEATDPLVLADDAGSEYLRYNDEIVIISPRQPSGSTITLDEDLDNDYRRGKYRHLGYGFDPGSPFKGSGRQRLYGDPIVAAEQSRYQHIVLTERNGDLRLYLDGDLQFSSLDEHRYTETLVHPALGRDPERVLILGGGDGLAARDALRNPSVREVVQVELDPAVVEVANTRLAGLNERSLRDPGVHLVIGDAFAWMRERAGRGFDAVVVDLPDPDTPVLGRLYSVEFYGLVAAALRPGGLLVVQSGSPYSTPTAYWRTFGDWGLVLAQPGPKAPELRGLPRDRSPQHLAPSTLDRPRIVQDMRQGYVG